MKRLLKCNQNISERQLVKQLIIKIFIVEACVCTTLLYELSVVDHPQEVYYSLSCNHVNLVPYLRNNSKVTSFRISNVRLVIYIGGSETDIKRL
jgi:hypothetical protein